MAVAAVVVTYESNVRLERLVHILDEVRLRGGSIIKTHSSMPNGWLLCEIEAAVLRSFSAELWW